MSDTPFPAFASQRRLPNVFDLFAGACLLAVLIYVIGVARTTFAPLSAPEATAISLDPANLPVLRRPHHAAHVRRPGLLAPVHLHLCDLGRQEPPRRADPDPDPRRAAVRADPRLPHLHRRLLHGAVPRQGARRRARRDLRHLHQPGLEHGVQPLPVAEDHPRRPRRGRQELPPLRLAALLAARSPVRHARPGLEHHDEHVRRLVLRRRLRGDHGRRHHRQAPGHRQLRRAGAGGAQHRRGVLRHPHDADRDPALRPAAVPPAGRLVGQVPLRADRLGGRRGSLDAQAAAPDPAAARGLRHRRVRVQRARPGCASRRPG